MMSEQWNNWSGSVACTPRRIATPSSEAETCALVRDAANEGMIVRVAGTGHSFTPLVATDGLLLSLDQWTGIESVDAARLRVTVRAGMKLHDLGEALLQHGLAMANLGDVDVQSLAGAVSTGTHGTGPTLGNLSTYVCGARIVTGSGDLVDVSKEDLPALRVSLGTLGVLSALTLQVLPAYRLHERVWREPIDRCLARLDERIADNTRYEFFWFPTGDEVECKTLNPTDRPADEASADLVMGTPASLEAGVVRAPAERERVGWSAWVIPSVRARMFNEMEYALPAEMGPACFRAVRERMLARHPAVLWPVEYRTLAADDAWLSPAFGRESVTISIHQDARLPFQDFFADIEPIFQAHDGRPHWGKIHSGTPAGLQERYPRWSDFQQAREQLDSAGRFLNPYLRTLFGTDAGG